MPTGKRPEEGRGGRAETVSDVRAILVSDLHLQARAPVARAAEPDWFEAMARPLREIEGLAHEHGCPILYAGDIFDRWNSSPEVINFALANLPAGWAVPGQHDLPNHDYDEIKRSAYWTLVKAGKLHPLEPGKPTTISSGHVGSSTIEVTGFPWGFDPAPATKGDESQLRVALIHRFIWTKDTGYPGAPTSRRVGKYKGALAGYDVAAFGDNHKGFIKPTPGGGPVICNCGGLMRRKTDEVGYRPGVGLLRADGLVRRHHFDTTEDKILELTEAEEAVERLLDMSSFVDQLRGLEAGDALDFMLALRRFLDDNAPADRVREIVLQATEGDQT